MLTFPPGARLGEAHRGGLKRKQARGFGLAAHPSHFEERREESQLISAPSSIASLAYGRSVYERDVLTAMENVSAFSWKTSPFRGCVAFGEGYAEDDLVPGADDEAVERILLQAGDGYQGATRRLHGRAQRRLGILRHGEGDG